jgi:hypothetical protein
MGERKDVVKSSDKKIDGKVLPKSELAVLQKLKGEPIPTCLRKDLEAKLLADLSAVRVHVDANAFRVASAIGARCFSLGNDVYFNGGQYNPNTNEGRDLLAHELTHVVQQRSQGNQGR